MGRCLATGLWNATREMVREAVVVPQSGDTAGFRRLGGTEGVLGGEATTRLFVWAGCC